MHAFFGENANNGLQTGAFYAYPNPKDDKAYMILKGKYKVNETEMKDVSYQIPFMQQGANGNATWFDIANNHRYTIAITQADAYHLDANILVADWADDGSIEYTPDNKPGEIVVTIPEAFKDDSEYDEEAKTVSMSLLKGSSITLSTTSNSPLGLTRIYAGGHCRGEIRLDGNIRSRHYNLPQRADRIYIHSLIERRLQNRPLSTYDIALPKPHRRL